MTLLSHIARSRIAPWALATALIGGAWSVGFAAQEAPFVPGVANHPQLTPVQTGRVLLSELNCAACHELNEMAGPAASKGAPILSAVASGVQPDYLQRFIADPQGVKPGTTMPDALHGATALERREAALAISHFLRSGISGSFSDEAIQTDAVERGRRLYHSAGCVACHSPEEALPDSVPLGDLENGRSLRGLTDFLENPLDVRPGGRMPDMRLDHWEAVDIASYLLRNRNALPHPGKPDADLATRGKELFSKYRCADCHETKPATNLTPRRRLTGTRLNEGCLSDGAGAWPRYSLSKAQRSAIQAALRPGAPAPTRHEQIEIEMARFNCHACHKRDGRGGVSAARDSYFTTADPNLGEQGRIPPDLTLVGAKLKLPWLRKVVAHGASARPYMNARMPKFGEENVGSLIDLIKRADRVPPTRIERVKDVRESRKIGHELAGTRGLSCVSCHPFRGQSSSTIQATDLGLMYERLEEQWFHRYMTDPQRVSPLTIMPSFWPGGKSSLPNVLDGNPSQQRDALWQYLARGPEARRPAGIQLEPLKLVVKDEAVMLRRSYQGIGKRGIGVGYPGGVNLSFDAGQIRLASIWRGEFIEASGVWRGQGHGNVRVQGDDVVKFPEGPALAALESPDQFWPKADGKRSAGFQFRGYTLDAKQRPTFQYDFRDFSIADAFLDAKGADGRSYFKRTLSWKSDGDAESLFLRVAEDESIEKAGDNDYRVGKTLRIRLPHEGRIRSTDKGSELILPLKGHSTAIIEYHWASAGKKR